MTALIGGALRTISLVMPVSWVMNGGIGLPGIDQGGPFPFDAVAVETHRADFDDGVVLRIKTGCFDVDGDNRGHAVRLYQYLDQIFYLLIVGAGAVFEDI